MIAECRDWLGLLGVDNGDAGPAAVVATTGSGWYLSRAQAQLQGSGAGRVSGHQA